MPTEPTGPRDTATSFGRYLVVGGIGTAVHLAVLAGCVELLGWHPTAGSVAGFLAALAVSFTLNHRWAFRSRRAPLAALWRYVAVCGSGLALNTAMMHALVRGLGWDYFVAQLSVVLIVPVSNYLLNRYWSFGDARPPAAAERPLG